MVLHRHLTAVQGASRELSALIQSGLGIGHQEAADDEVLRTRLCTWTKLGGSMPHCRLRGSATDTPPPVRKLARDDCGFLAPCINSPTRIPGQGTVMWIM